MYRSRERRTRPTKSTGKLVVFDLLFYAILPYAIWLLGRQTLSDYHALLLSTVPGFVYTIGRFAKERSWNVTGVFLIVALMIGTTVDVLSGNAELMIQNNIRILFAFGLFFLASMVANRPMALYFFADTVKVLGVLPDVPYEKGKNHHAFQKRELMPYFQVLTLLFVLRYLVIAFAKMVMFSMYGVDGYGILIWWRVALSWGFGALILLASLYVAQRVRNKIET